MNPIALVVFILIIVAGIVSLGIEVFKGSDRSPAAKCFFFSVMILGLADLYFVKFGTVNASLSAWIVSHGGGDGFWKFTIGCACGHLFFPMIKVTQVTK